MAHSRLVKILILVITALMISTSGAWAASLEDDFNWDTPRVSMKHVTAMHMIDGRTKYWLLDDDIERGAEPQIQNAGFLFLYINLSNIPAGESGEITFNSNGQSYVKYYDIATQSIVTEEAVVPSGLNTFKVWQWPGEETEFFVGNSNGDSRAEFVTLDDIRAETTFSQQDFLINVSNVVPTGGTFSKIRATEEQLSRSCVPYISMDIKGSVMTDLHWKFADPFEVYYNPEIVPETKTQSAINDVIRVNRIWVRTKDGVDYYKDFSPSLRFNDGDKLEGMINYPQGIQAKNIRFIELVFNYSDRLSTNCYTEYKWRFYPAWRTDPDGRFILLPSRETEFVKR